MKGLPMLEGLLIDELFSGENQYVREHRGHTIVVVVEDSSLLSTKARLFVDGRLIDTAQALSTTVRLQGTLGGHGRPHQIEVRVSLRLLGGVRSCDLVDDTGEYPMPPRRSDPSGRAR